MQKLQEDCKGCQRCRLRTGATQVVPGDGDFNSEILFIGEGPGAVEDRTGKPFVGPAGKFLDILLNSIGLAREKVFITNTVKCRPPDNRDPFDDEKQICSFWLNEQIRLINPKVFVPLGRHALHQFLPDITISKAHGRLYKYNGRVIFAMYHPAVALYNGGMRQTLLDDMKNLQKFLSEGGSLDNPMLESGGGELSKPKSDKLSHKSKSSPRKEEKSDSHSVKNVKVLINTEKKDDGQITLF